MLELRESGAYILIAYIAGSILHVCLRWIDVCISGISIASEFNALSAFAVHAFFKFFSSSRSVLDLQSSL